MQLQQPKPAMPSVPVMDKTHFTTVTQNNPAFQKELLHDFITGTEEAVAHLLAHPCASPQWATAAHKLKGSAVNLGFAQLAACCAAAEQETNPPSKSRHLHQIEGALLALQPLLAPFLSI